MMLVIGIVVGVVLVFITPFLMFAFGFVDMTGRRVYKLKDGRRTTSYAMYLEDKRAKN